MANRFFGRIDTNAYYIVDENDTGQIDYLLDPASNFQETVEQPAIPYQQQGWYYLLSDLTWEWRQTADVPVRFNVLTNEIRYNVWNDEYAAITPAMLGAATETEVQSLQTALAALTARVDALTA